MAHEHGCDFIVMASHGRRGISALLIGSETNKVLIISKLPCSFRVRRITSSSPDTCMIN